MKTIKILQWNVWYKEPIENTVSEILRVNADILCLQELTIGYSHQNGLDGVKAVADATGYYHYHHAMKNMDDGSQANAIFSKYPILSSRFVHINMPESTGGFDDEYRAYIEVVVDVNGSELTIATTHMSYTDRFIETPRKLREYEKLEKELPAEGSYVFTGDLNTIPTSKIVERISKRLFQACPDLSLPTWTTKPFSYNGFEVEKLDWRLDYAFTSKNINVLSSEILSTDYSDHLPILIEIEV